MSCQFLDPCGGGLRGSRRYEVVARNRGRARREAREDIVIPYIFLFSKCISPSSQLSLYWLALARIGRYKSNTARKRIEVRYLHYNRQQVTYRKERQIRNRTFSQFPPLEHPATRPSVPEAVHKDLYQFCSANSN